MATTTNQPYMNKSLNGIIVYDDGAGGSMEGGVITCNTLATPLLEADGLQAYTAGASCNLYTNTLGGASDIHIGNAGITLFIDSGVASTSPIYCSELHATNMYAGTSVNTTFLDTPFTTDTPYLWPFVSGAITIGSATSPIIGNYVCTANNHLANKQYVDSALPTSLLGLTNVWTGASNTFNNFLDTNTIRSIATGATVNLFNNLTTGSLTIGSGLTSGTLNLGGTTESGDLNIRTTGILNLGIVASSINLGTTALTSNIIQMANSSTISLNLGNTMTTGGISIGGALTTGSIGIGANATTGTVNIRTGGTMNLGVASTVINIGTTSCPTINIGNATTSFLTLNTPINPNYDTKYTATGSPSNCIGEILAPTFGAVANMTTNTNYTMGTFTNLPVGVWMLYWNQVYFVASTNAVFGGISMSIGTTVNGIDIGQYLPETATSTQNVGLSKSYLYTQIYSNLLATTDVYLTTNCTFTGTLRASASTITNMKAVRLA